MLGSVVFVVCGVSLHVYCGLRCALCTAVCLIRVDAAVCAVLRISCCMLCGLCRVLRYGVLCGLSDVSCCVDYVLWVVCHVTLCVLCCIACYMCCVLYGVCCVTRVV